MRFKILLVVDKLPYKASLCIEWVEMYSFIIVLYYCIIVPKKRNGLNVYLQPLLFATKKCIKQASKNKLLSRILLTSVGKFTLFKTTCPHFPWAIVKSAAHRKLGLVAMIFFIWLLVKYTTVKQLNNLPSLSMNNSQPGCATLIRQLIDNLGWLTDC